MTDLVDRIRKELDARIEQLRPLVDEFERLQGAVAALAGSAARAMPGVVARRPAATKPARTPAGRSARPKPAAGRRVTARRRIAASPEREPAEHSSTAEPAARKPRVRRRGTAARSPAPRGQTRAKVLAALRAAPGSTTAAVATAAGIPANTASATISRLVKQGRVRRLDKGGYAPVESHSVAAQAEATPATAEAALGDSDARGAQAPAPTDAPTPD
jgi:hypothetical protein